MKISKILSVVAFVFLLAGCNPVPPVPADWATGETDELTFRYPADFGSEYVTPQNWPPTVTLADGTPDCLTELEKIGGNKFCETESSEGAAGSIYKTYDYRTNFGDDQTLAIEFVLQFPECGNFPEPEMEDCQKAQSNLDLDTIVTQIAMSAKAK